MSQPSWQLVNQPKSPPCAVSNQRVIYESIDQVLHDTGKGNLYREKTETVRKTVISLVAQTVQRLSTMQETWVPSLGREDSLEKEKATHSSTLA